MPVVHALADSLLEEANNKVLVGGGRPPRPIDGPWPLYRKQKHGAFLTVTKWPGGPDFGVTPFLTLSMHTMKTATAFAAMGAAMVTTLLLSMRGANGGVH